MLTAVYHTEVALETPAGPGLRTAGEPRQWHQSQQSAQDAIDLGVVKLEYRNRHPSDIMDLWAVVDR